MTFFPQIPNRYSKNCHCLYKLEEFLLEQSEGVDLCLLEVEKQITEIQERKKRKKTRSTNFSKAKKKEKIEINQPSITLGASHSFLILHFPVASLMYIR
jgi:hypothetical protein